jgi:prepilin-type N-terminal cleavage/methylation domain-containing protein
MRQKIKERGFTLVEVLTSLFIIVIISGIVFANYRQSGQQFALQRSANKLAQDIRRAQAMAMGAKEYSGSVPPGYGFIVLAGWNDKKYRIYADTNGNGIFDDGVDTVVETMDLEKGVYFKEACTPSGCGVCGGSINFRPPDPTMNICRAVCGENEITIILALSSDPSKQKLIRVNKAGLIEIE